MADSRVTQAEVKALIDTQIEDITEFINTANHLVSDVLANSGLSTTRLKDIEMWLAAHFVAIRDQDEGQLVGQWVNDQAKAEYSSSLGQSLRFTRYGQQALALDTSGTLNSLGKVRAQFRVL